MQGVYIGNLIPEADRGGKGIGGKGIGVWDRGRGGSHIKVTGMLVGKFKLNPQGRPMWVWLKLKLKEISVCHQCQGFFYVQY